MADLLRIASSGLLAYQGALNTTGNNITNANVAGYSRQRVELGTQPSQYLSGAFFGNGVTLDSVSRIVDQFIVSQMRTDTSLFNRNDTLRFYTEQLDGILSDSNVGLSQQIDRFFNALQIGADDPLFLPNRAVVLSEARGLQTRIGSMYTYLSDLARSVDTQFDALAGELTVLARNVAKLNAQIGAVSGLDSADQPNDLLDERDRLIQQIAAIVDVQVVHDGASANLFVGKGQSLVVGAQSYQAVTRPDPLDPTRKELALLLGSGARVVSGEGTGGKIGGLLQFRDQILDQAFNSLGRVALAIAGDVNRQNALGMDLDGALGGLVFADVNDPEAARFRARAASDNDPASTGGVRVFIDDPAQLTTSDYRLDIGAGGSWQLFRLADSSTVASGAGPLTDTLVTVDGFTLDLNLSEVPPGNFVAGDSFLIEPTRRGGRDFAAVISDPRKLAFASPVRAISQAGNLGTGAIEVATTFDTSTPMFANQGRLTPNLLLLFTTTTTIDVRDAGTGAVLLSGVSFTPGVSNTLFSANPGDPDYFGFQLTLSGAPARGDRFEISYNTGGVSDNTNARALAALQTDARVNGSTVSYQQAYGELIGFVGAVTRQARIDTGASQALLDQTTALRESVSGVNLDEEAANLIRFEQAYNASAQVVAVARSIIETLFDAFR